MRRLGAVLGGEESGHMIFLDHQTTGDGILGGLQVLAAMVKTGRPMSELAGLMEVFPQALVNVEVASKPAIESVPAIREAIAWAEAELKGRGRVLIRYSGTQNLCRVMVEGPTTEDTDRLAHELARIVRSALEAGDVFEADDARP
jgi:phosphoglucosamine mutase